MRVAFLTLGCKVNSYETEKMKINFEKKGHSVVAFDEEADAYIINTCTVTNIADRKSRKMLHRAKRLNPEAVVVATGCYVDSARAKGEVDESVDLFISNSDKDNLVEIVLERFYQINGQTLEQDAQNNCRADIQLNSLVHENMSEAAIKEEHTRAYIKIQDGCNQYCTYCIIPYVRGPLRSKSLEDIRDEVTKLAEAGYKEIVVTGIHLSSYGVNGKKSGEFLEKAGKPLLEALETIDSVEGVERIRLGSLEPRIITDGFASRLSKIKTICPHFHLSLQSGCDNTLKAMNRHYNCSEYAEIVTNLRNAFENSSMTTDVMVGFAGETEEDFNASLKFVKSIGFAKVHIFPYSRRKGTVADKAPNQIDPQIKEQRAKIMEQVCDETRREFLKDQVGLCESVLVERLRHGYLEGYTKNYTPVHINSEDTSLCGKIIDVKITKSFDDYCDAELV